MNGGIGRGKHSFPQPLLQLIDSKVRARKAVLNKKPVDPGELNAQIRGKVHFLNISSVSV